MKVLIVGVNYAPEHSGIAPYTTGMAEYLQRLGHDVTVLTGMPHYPAWTVDTAYRGRLNRRERRNGVLLVRRALYVPARQSAVKRAAYEASFLLTGLLPLRIARPDAVIGVIPTLSGGVLARLLARRYRAPYGVLFQDLMGPAAQQSGIGGGGHVARLASHAEGWTVRGATAVAAVSTSFFPYLRDLGAIDDRLVHVPNWTHVPTSQLGDEARNELRRELGWADDEVVALHAGNMGHKQHLAQVLTAAKFARAQDAKIRFVLLGDGNQRASLLQTVVSEQIENVQFIAPQSDDRFSLILAAADVLLVTERASVHDMALPSKLTSYAIAGRPVVAAVNDDGATAAELRLSGMALVEPPEDPGAIVSAIQRLASDEAFASGMVAAARIYAAQKLRPQPALDRAVAFVGLVAKGRTTHHTVPQAV